MALDHPARITAAAVFDVVATGDVWARADAQLALWYWHWSFLARPAPLPERLINADPDAFFDYHVRALGIGVTADRHSEALCEDYRAGATLDRAHDEGDLGQRKIQYPLLSTVERAQGTPAPLRRCARGVAPLGGADHRSRP